jgi:stage II sporulation protein D
MPRAGAAALVACVLTTACGSDAKPEGRDSSRVAVRPVQTPPALYPPISPSSRDDPTPEEAADALHQASWARLRWPGGQVVASNLPARLDEPVLAGSIFKLVAARAALAQGLIRPDTQVVCPRRVELQGRHLDCVHPDLGRPLTLADAIAHSCNHFFVRLADRLDRGQLASTLRELSEGALTVSTDGRLPLVVLGLEGPRASMRTWARIALRAMTPDASDISGTTQVRGGAALAAMEGTASALAEPRHRTLAKTGTTMGEGGVQEGRVVAWRPEEGEAIVVRASGVAGRDAARVARIAWAAAAVVDDGYVRVGRLRDRQAAPGVGGIERVPLEAYVAGVVAAEGESTMPPGALQALAIAARSYVRGAPARHPDEGYDVCDTTHCQVFGPATPGSRDAAMGTRALVLADAAGLVTAPYSASCSGVLSSPREVWGGTAADITRTGKDPVEHRVPQWESTVRADVLIGALHEAGYRGDVLRDVRIVASAREGVPSRVGLDGMAPSEVGATTFRHIVGRLIGWEVLKSHAWDVRRVGAGYRFTGRGKGHGAGVCLQGAAALAARGGTLEQVLATYVPGAAIVSTLDAITVRVPAAMTGEAPRLRLEARATLAELRRRLGVGAPRAVDIDVHPTVQAYQRATGRAWWTGASTRPLSAASGGDRAASAETAHTAVSPGTGLTALRFRIDIAPAASGRLSSVLATLQHEMVHVLTGTVLTTDGPAWAAEGLAEVATGAQPMDRVESARRARPSSGSAETTSRCPTEQEITHPGSLEEMRHAYRRAGTCVAAALPAGLEHWRTLTLR